MRYTKYLPLLVCGLTLFWDVSADESMTKSQLLKTFYKANTFQDAGNDSMAIVTLESIAARIPRLPITYLRMAEIYDKRATGKNDQMSLNAAVLMYRRYLSLELDEQKTAEASTRLRTLEDKLKVAHFEDEDAKEGAAELTAQKAIPIVTSDVDADKVVEATVQKQTVQLVTPVTRPVEPQAPLRVEAAPSEQPLLSTPEPATPTVPDSVAVENVSLAETLANFDESALLTQRCDRPLDLAALKISRLKAYEIEVVPVKQQPRAGSKTLTATQLEGHWVSSLTNAAGRETWIFDIEPFGDNCSVTLRPESGILQEVDDDKVFFNKIVNLLEENEFLSNTTQSIACDQVEGSLKGKSMTFTLESEKTYKPSTSIYTWSRTILENLSSLLPFGNMLYKIGDGLLSKQTEKDVEATFNIESRFDCSVVSDGVLECKYASKEKKLTKSGSKLIHNDLQRFYLYRTNADYVCFTPMDITKSDDPADRALFEQVKKDAAKALEYNYPLAVMYHYGIGTEVSDADAIEVMTQLAKEKQCGRAMTWLATYYFNLAYNSKSDISASTRKKYLKSSLYWLGKMRELQMPSFYALKADMNESCNETDSILQYYKMGAMKGDVYASYKLGECALKGRYMKKNPVVAQKCIEDACAKNYPEAFLLKAQMYKEGLGLPADTAAYIANVCKAVDLGSANALSELSTAYIRGVGVERDFQMGNLMRDYRFRADASAWIDILAVYGYDVSNYR